MNLSLIKENIKKYKIYYIFLVFINIIIAVLGIGFALSMQYLIDETKNGYSLKLVQLGVTLLVIVLVQIAFQFLSSFLLIRLKGKVRTNLQRLVFENLLSQNSLVDHSGKYLNIITSDVSYLTEGLIFIIPKSVLIIAKFIGCFIAIGIIDYRLLLGILLIGLIIICCHYFYKKFLSKYHKDYQNKEAISRSFMQEMLENHSIVHSFGKDKFIFIENNNRLSDLYKIEIKRSSIYMFANLGLSIGLLFSYALIIVYGALKLSSGSFIYDSSFTFGSLVAIMSLFTQLQSPLVSVSDISQRYVLMKESAQRIMDVMKKKEEVKNNIKDFKKIKLSDFSFAYKDKIIFSHTDFILKKNDQITIKGPSGIGKSTLIKILLGKLKSDKPILIDNQVSSLNDLVCYVPQGNWLLSGTIKDNLTVFDSTIPLDKINEALKCVCLTEFIHSLPDGIDSKISERAKDISEGQAQRIAIARGLLLDRPILLLDEVTSALDKALEEEILKNLSNLGKTIIYISHKDATNNYSNRILEIKNQKIVEVLK